MSSGEAQAEYLSAAKSEAEQPNWLPGSATTVADALATMFAEHGIESVRDGERLRFPAHDGLWANGAAVREYPRALQIDVRLGIEPDRTLIESVAGIGTEDEPSIRDGLAAFHRGTIAVLLAAFFGKPDLVVRQRWTVGERKRLVFIGQVTTRFGMPKDTNGKADIRFFDHFKANLLAQPLPLGVHWIRHHQMRMDGKVMSNEVLLDNNLWPEMQDMMAAFDWPPSEDKTYDARVFLVMRDG
jgi:hypothetical protein